MLSHFALRPVIVRAYIRPAELQVTQDCATLTAEYACITWTARQVRHLCVGKLQLRVPAEHQPSHRSPAVHCCHAPHQIQSASASLSA
jgi:hypothetical protein